MTEMLTANTDTIEMAAKLLKNGEVVAFPTETVYGLGGVITTPSAIDKIFEAKGRPRDNPLIVHVSAKDQVVPLIKEFPKYAEVLMDKFWPGPLTLVMPASDLVLDCITAGLESVAIRMPDNSVALDLISATGVPVAAPSANRSGFPSPTKAGHVLEDMKGRIPLIIDGGATGFGLESTVLDLTEEVPTVLRPGAITLEMLWDAGVHAVLDSGLKPGETPKSPGLKYRHYAPNADVVIVMDKYELAKKLELCDNKEVGILAQSDWKPTNSSGLFYPLSTSGSVEESAALLFDGLRVLDGGGAKVIFVQGFEDNGLGMAYMNRLKKAAYKGEGKI
ncbi:MAG: threonylcarbamoyl-AMP synthase [Tissierellia bacterium]|nr:threonylcarbamoyl-AMP synthase [Tissierellia bacterium]